MSQYYPCKKCKTKERFCQLNCPKFKRAKLRDAKKRLYDKYGDENNLNYKMYALRLYVSFIIVLAFVVFSVLCILFTLGELLR